MLRISSIYLRVLFGKILERDIRSGFGERGLFDSAHEVLLVVGVSECGHVVVRREVDSARLGEDLEPLCELLPFVALAVVVRAVRLRALLPVLARIQLVVVRVVLLLLPAVTVTAPVLIRTPVLVLVYERPRSPIRALLFLVDIQLRFPSEILPVVREHTEVALVLALVVGAPDSLEVEHVEVAVLVELVDQLHADFALGMRERAVVAILALASALGVRRAELRFVLVRVVELLDTVVRLGARVAAGTGTVGGDCGTDFGLVGTERTALVLLLVVVVRTSLQIVRVRVLLARRQLEQRQVQKTAIVLGLTLELLLLHKLRTVLLRYRRILFLPLL